MMDDESKTVRISTAPASERAERREQVCLPEHLIELAGGEWALWRCVGLRGTGFPVEGVLKLAMSHCAAAADGLLEAEDHAERKWGQAQDAIRREMDDADENRLAKLKKALKQLQKGKVPEAIAGAGEAEAKIKEFAVLCEKVDLARLDFEEAFKEGTMRVSESLRGVAMTKRFREAVTWQNRNALHTGINRLLGAGAQSGVRDSKRRQHEELVASYLQRYCTKNDTIGFFGPVGWARFVSQGDVISVRPGPRFLAARDVYFEPWCIDAIAETIARRLEIKPWIAPRRIPTAWLEGKTLHIMLREPVELSGQEAAILSVCDGHRTAREVAGRLLQNQAPEFESAADVYHALESMEMRGLITWTLLVASGPRPERRLRQLIERIGERQMREQALSSLDEMERARKAVAEAAGDADRLDQALGELETTFTRLTGMDPTQSEGRTYAGRTLVVEDCRRDIEVEIGPRLLESLGPPLNLLLASARWLVAEVAAVNRKALDRLYKEITRKTGRSIVPAAEFFARAQALLMGEQAAIEKSVQSEFQRRWAEILRVPPVSPVFMDQRRVSYDSEQLKPRVLEKFKLLNRAPACARYHSPDVLIAATSAEAIRRDDYLLALGELHVAQNTLGSSFFVEQHPSPEDLFRAVEMDLSEPRIALLHPKYLPGMHGRCNFRLTSSRDLHLEISPDSPSMPDANSMAIGSLVVERDGKGLIARAHDHSQSFDIIDAFADAIIGQVINSFKLMPPSQHMPRVTFDRLVVSRETWRFSPFEMDFVYEDGEALRFLGARQWVRDRGLPRFVYMKSPVEVKPCFVDLESPILVNIFSKMVRRAAEEPFAEETGSENPMITVTEMLPGLDQCWLPDDDGQRYTCELRIIARDLTF